MSVTTILWIFQKSINLFFSKILWIFKKSINLFFQKKGTFEFNHKRQYELIQELIMFLTKNNNLSSENCQNKNLSNENSKIFS